MIFSALEWNSQNHWNKAVLNLTQNVKKVLSEMDKELALACQTKVEDENSKSSVAAEKRRLTWERIETAASCQPSTNNHSGVTESATYAITC